ncbi:MAG: hypothetical protein ChlgKO_14470 [Chlamydiales bacterium]
MEPISNPVLPLWFIEQAKLIDSKEEAKSYVSNLTAEQVRSFEQVFYEDFQPYTEIFRTYVLLRFCAEERLTALEAVGIIDIHAIIELFATDYAKEVNVKLVRKIVGEETGDFPFLLETIPGVAPFEYFDGAPHHIQTHSYSTIYSTRITRHFIKKEMVTCRGD